MSQVSGGYEEEKSFRKPPLRHRRGEDLMRSSSTSAASLKLKKSAYERSEPVVEPLLASKGKGNGPLCEEVKNQ